MKAILKKNQVIISVIALMLIVAGYMNYTTNEQQVLQTVALTDTKEYADLGDAQLVSANIIQEDSNTEQNQKQNEEIPNNQETEEKDTEKKEETVNTSTGNSQYFTESRLERDKMYSQMLESYQNILSNSQISDAQKEISENEIKNINDTKNAIMITENLIKNKGFEDLIIFINGDSINIVVKSQELSEEQIAKIQNVVSRELHGDIDNIHISCKT